MSQRTIGIGASANDGTGDPLRTAFGKVNQNFTELYGAAEMSGSMLGLAGDGSTDDQSKIQTALDAGNSIYLDKRAWYACGSKLQIKFHGQRIRCVNERFGLLFTSDTDGIWVIAPFAEGSVHGGGADYNALENITVKGPGTYTASDGSFSGSTGIGFLARNTGESFSGTWSGGAFSGDYLTMMRVHLENWGKAGYINGFGNMRFCSLAVEFNGDGLFFGDTTGNGSFILGLTLSNNSTFGLRVKAGIGWDILLEDVGVDPGSSTVPIILEGTSTGTLRGGNNEGASTAGPLISIAGGLTWTIQGVSPNKGSGGDHSPITVGTSARVHLTNCTSGSFTAATLAIGADNGGVTGNFTGATLKTNGQTVCVGPFEVVTDSGVDTPTAAQRGRFLFVASTSGGLDDIVCQVQSGSGTYLTLSMNPLKLLAANQTVVGNWTWNGNQRIILPGGGAGGGAGSSSGGLEHKASSLSFFWRTSQAESNDLALYSGTNQRLIITEAGIFQWNAGIALPGVPTSDPHVAGVVWNNSGVATISAG